LPLLALLRVASRARRWQPYRGHRIKRAKIAIYVRRAGRSRIGNAAGRRAAERNGLLPIADLLRRSRRGEGVFLLGIDG
jgi:hypothetical protein